MRYETSSIVSVDLIVKALRLPIIFLVLLIFTLALTGSTSRGLGQSATTNAAFDKLVQAYTIVQSADSHGVSHDEVIRLLNELNQALIYYENSTTLLTENNSTGAAAYATLSINLSSDVASKAHVLESNAEAQLLERQGLAYALAVSLAAVSAFAVVEFHRFSVFYSRRKAFKTPIRRGES